MGLTYPQGSAVHCTCGSDAEWLAKANACRCDCCLPAGAFAANGAEPKRGAPNFWHKPSGLKVWWYKYIGRGMEVVDPNGANIASVLHECLSVVARPPAESSPTTNPIPEKGSSPANGGKGQSTTLTPGEP